MLKLSIVIPVYNEENSIEEVILELKKSLNKIECEYEIIVVDDGSTDRTGEIVEKLDVKVFHHPVNAGYGQALLTGINSAQYEYVATIDGDGSYSVDDIIKLLNEAQNFDLVIGARKGKNFWGNLIKHPARIIFLYLAEFTVGQKIPDVNSGLRIFKKSCFPQIDKPLLCKGFSFSSTMTLSFLANGMFVKFVPIKYFSRKGKSKVNYIRDTLRTLQVLIEVITYYNPLKIILLFCCIPGFCFFIFLILYFITKNQWYNLLALISFYTVFLFFIIGLILDLIRLKFPANKL